MLGKMGSVFCVFANGYDDSPVRKEDTHAPIKSVRNSIKTYRDLVNDADVKIFREDIENDDRHGTMSRKSTS